MLRFPVQRRARRDVTGDVGDRDDQPPAAAHRFAPHRVVEIARIFAVDRDQRQLAQIFTTALGRRTTAWPNASASATASVGNSNGKPCE